MDVLGSSMLGTTVVPGAGPPVAVATETPLPDNAAASRSAPVHRTRAGAS